VNAWWISWYHHPDDGEFELHTPWWVSGYTLELGAQRSVIVASVPARSEEAAWAAVEASYDTAPARLERRFCDPLEDREQQPNVHRPWSSDGGRFPRADWMQWPL